MHRIPALFYLSNFMIFNTNYPSHDTNLLCLEANALPLPIIGHDPQKPSTQFENTFIFSLVNLETLFSQFEDIFSIFYSIWK